jgi:cell division protease FtsH
MVGADLANVVNEAALLAARRVAEAVEMRDFEEAIDRVMLGLEKTGAANDLERASELTRQMVTRFGMSERLGKLTYGRPLTARFLSSPFSAEERNYSERTAEQIDEDARRIVDESYERV